ncbi:hypothetical protein [Actinoallomurus iriomotensis]|uniref:Uncharacterized protein n=1 Tax=Actinoallomurus iriomotensis TaxID=478107 RepID=A0A9W6VW41_9ACTN|nr:hypothetical protein [Actinoallomurus iriomotensis]GLY81834.1 hypothetical protein Airi01_101010 [Actinoallomurus iriomotensis]
MSWSQDDRDKAIWTWLRERQTCSSCGTRPDEWDPKRGGDRRAYVAQVEICRGCQAVQARNAGLTEDQRHGGAHVVLRPREVAHAGS